MVSGRVDSWDEELGWGVLTSPEVPGKLFGHFSEIQGEGYRYLSAGDRVSFDYREAPPGGVEGCPFIAERILLTG